MDGKVNGGAGGGISWSNYQDNEGIDTSSSAEVAAVKELVTAGADRYKSNVSRSDGDSSTNGSANNDPANPKLKTPDFQDPAVSDAALKKLFDPNALMQAYDNGIDGYLAAAQAADDAEAEKITVTDPEIIRIANERGVSPGVLYKAMQNMTDGELDKVLNSLPPEEGAQLKMAMAYPGSVTLSPALSKALQDMKDAINGKVRSEFGLGQGWSGQSSNLTTSKQSIDNDIDITFNEVFDQELNNIQPPLTDTQRAQLRTMHYAPPGVKLPTDPALLALLKTIEGKVNAQLQAKYGFDADWTPPPDTEYYAAIMEGAFVDEFKKAAENSDPPLTREDALNIDTYASKYFANPNDPDIPSDVKKMLGKLVGVANAAVINKFGLDSAWKADTAGIHPAQMDLKSFKMAQGAVKVLRDMLAFAQSQIPNIPPSAERQRLENYLKTIGKAISDMEEAMYAMESGHGDIARVMSRLRAEIQESDIKQQEAQEAQIKDKQGSKMEKVIPLDFMDVLTKITIVAAAIVLSVMVNTPPNPGGALIAAIAISAAIAYVSKPSLADTAFAAVQDGCVTFGKAIGGPAGEDFGKILGTVVNTYLSMVLSGGNPILAVTLFTQNTKATETFAGVCGADENQQKICAAVVGAVVQVVMAVAMTMMTGGGASASLMATVGEAMNVSEKVMKAATTLAKVVMVAFQLTTTTIQGYNSVIEMKTADINASVTMIKARSEAMTEELQALIKVIRQLLDKIMSALQGIPNQILDLDKFQGEKWSKADSMISELFS